MSLIPPFMPTIVVLDVYVCFLQVPSLVFTKQIRRTGPSIKEKRGENPTKCGFAILYIAFCNIKRE